MSYRSRLKGFTLIELLVVVAIIALLIAILLPSLSRAREQARIAKCLSNLKSMGTAAHTYLNDHTRRDFPWVLPYYYFAEGKRWTFGYYTEYIYGGGMPDGVWTRENWPYGGNSPAAQNWDVYVFPPRMRPLNPYFSSSVTWDRNDPNMDIPPFVSNLPDTFKCPSDFQPATPGAFDSNLDQLEADTPAPLWRVAGTSYAISWYWPYYYNDIGVTRNRAEEGKTDKNYNTRGKWVNILGGSVSIPSLGAKMLGRDPQGGWESKFILFYEGPLNVALEGARPRGPDGKPLPRTYPKNLRGTHKQLDRHVAVMLDGHAVYGNFDTRFVDGPGWTNWPNKPWKDDWAPYNDY